MLGCSGYLGRKGGEVGGGGGGGKGKKKAPSLYTTDVNEPEISEELVKKGREGKKKGGEVVPWPLSCQW